MLHTDQSLLNALKQDGRSEVWEHWLTTFFVDKQVRLPLLVLAMTAATIRALPVRISEPHLTLIRLAWWRDVINLNNQPSDNDPPLAQALHHVCQQNQPVQAALRHLIEIEASGVHAKPINETDIRALIKAKDAYEVSARHKLLAPHQMNASEQAEHIGFIQATARLVFSRWSQSYEIETPPLNIFIDEALDLCKHYLGTTRPANLPKATLVPIVAHQKLISSARHPSKRLPSRLGVLWRILIL